MKARLVGNSAPVVAQLLRAASGSEEWQPTEMETDGSGSFTLALQSLTSSFRYKVLAGSAASPAFDVGSCVRRVSPASTSSTPIRRRLAWRRGSRRMAATSTDPRAPTSRSRSIRTVPSRLGRWCSGPTPRSRSVPNHRQCSVATCSFGERLVPCGARRPRRHEQQGRHRILHPHSRRSAAGSARGPSGSDRRVTRLEEVDIAAEAQDDFGVSALELVYSVRGGGEKVVPLGDPAPLDIRHRPLCCTSRISTSRQAISSATTSARATLPRGKRQRVTQRHLLPRGQAVRGGVHPRAEQAPWAAAAATSNSTISWPRRRKLSSPRGSSIGAPDGAGCAVGSRTFARVETEAELEDTGRADVECFSRVDDAGSTAPRPTGRGPVRSAAHPATARADGPRVGQSCPKKMR